MRIDDLLEVEDKLASPEKPEESEENWPKPRFFTHTYFVWLVGALERRRRSEAGRRTDPSCDHLRDPDAGTDRGGSDGDSGCGSGRSVGAAAEAAQKHAIRQAIV